MPANRPRTSLRSRRKSAVNRPPRFAARAVRARRESRPPPTPNREAGEPRHGYASLAVLCAHRFWGVFAPPVFGVVFAPSEQGNRGKLGGELAGVSGTLLRLLVQTREDDLLEIFWQGLIQETGMATARLRLRERPSWRCHPRRQHDP